MILGTPTGKLALAEGGLALSIPRLTVPGGGRVLSISQRRCPWVCISRVNELIPGIFPSISSLTIYWRRGDIFSVLAVWRASKETRAAVRIKVLAAGWGAGARVDSESLWQWHMSLLFWSSGKYSHS